MCRFEDHISFIHLLGFLTKLSAVPKLSEFELGKILVTYDCKTGIRSLDLIYMPISRNWIYIMAMHHQSVRKSVCPTPTPLKIFITKLSIHDYQGTTLCGQKSILSEYFSL